MEGKGTPKNEQNQFCHSPSVKAMTPSEVERHPQEEGGEEEEGQEECGEEEGPYGTGRVGLSSCPNMGRGDCILELYLTQNLK